MSTVYLNGSYLPKDEVRISPDDRGFLLSDGVYEVTPFYGGRPFRLEEHRRRMERGLAFLRIDHDLSEFEEVHRRLVEENGLGGEPMSIVYVQVSRGAAPRTHAFPDPPCEPTVYAFAKDFQRPPADAWGTGYGAVTAPDRRWARVDIKSIALLPNVLAQQAAVDAGVEDALLIRDGIALEGSHNNVFMVFDGTLVTHPADHLILHGITRACVLEVAREVGMDVEERPILVEELDEADEIFFTGTTTEIRPTVELDGRPVETGRVGPVTRRIRDLFLTRVADETETPELAPERAGVGERG